MFGFYLFICLFVYLPYLLKVRKNIWKKSKVLKNEYKKKVRFEKEH